MLNLPPPPKLENMQFQKTLILVIYVFLKFDFQFSVATIPCDCKVKSWPVHIVGKGRKKRATLFSQRNPRPCDTATLRGERAGRSG